MHTFRWHVVPESVVCSSRSKLMSILDAWSLFCDSHCCVYVVKKDSLQMFVYLSMVSWGIYKAYVDDVLWSKTMEDNCLHTQNDYLCSSVLFFLTCMHNQPCLLQSIQSFLVFQYLSFAGLVSHYTTLKWMEYIIKTDLPLDGTPIKIIIISYRLRVFQDIYSTWFDYMCSDCIDRLSMYLLGHFLDSLNDSIPVWRF